MRIDKRVFILAYLILNMILTKKEVLKMSKKDEKNQYELIQKFLTNDMFHFNHLMIKGIIEFLYEKFGSEFWKYIIENTSEKLFSRFRQSEWEEAIRCYHFNKEEKRKLKEDRRREEKRQRNKELDEEERKYREKHPNPWGH